MSEALQQRGIARDDVIRLRGFARCENQIVLQVSELISQRPRHGAFKKTEGRWRGELKDALDACPCDGFV